MFGLGFGELVLILLIALIFIGPKKLPELAKGLGQGIKEFQKAAKGLSDQIQEESPSSTPSISPNANPKVEDKPKLADETAPKEGVAELRGAPVSFSLLKLIELFKIIEYKKFLYKPLKDTECT
jgi:sec-independent protein translocase protein TatA